MTTYEWMIKEGEEIGIQKGIQKGKLEVILKGFDGGLKISILANITDLNEETVIKILKENKRIPQ